MIEDPKLIMDRPVSTLMGIQIHGQTRQDPSVIADYGGGLVTTLPVDVIKGILDEDF
jgi:hypothetical protein